MRILLDSHVLLWLLADDPISPEARAAVESLDNEVWVSVASIWELEIKRRIGKLTFDGDVVEATLAAGLDLLDIHADHAVRAGRLPLHHRDPFDRMLIAQAIGEGCALATRDPAIRAYRVTLLEV